MSLVARRLIDSPTMKGYLSLEGKMPESDPKITALTTLIKTLEPLKDEQRIRVPGSLRLIS